MGRTYAGSSAEKAFAIGISATYAGTVVDREAFVGTHACAFAVIALLWLSHAYHLLSCES